MGSPESSSPTERFIDRYAELVVRVGVNVQPSQDVHVWGLIEHAGIGADGTVTPIIREDRWVLPPRTPSRP